MKVYLITTKKPLSGHIYSVSTMTKRKNSTIGGEGYRDKQTYKDNLLYLQEEKCTEKT